MHEHVASTNKVIKNVFFIYPVFYFHAKLHKIESSTKRIYSFLMPRCGNFTEQSDVKIRLNEGRAKVIWTFTFPLGIFLGQ